MFRYSIKIVLLALLFSVNANGAEEFTPLTFEADYTIQMKGARVAKMKRQFTRIETGAYRYHSETKTTGLISLFRKDRFVETSNWILRDGQMTPMDYYYSHSGGKKERLVNITFDWDNNRITNSINGKSWKMPASPNVMDKLLYQLAIMYDLKEGRENLRYTIADGGKIKDYNFEILGEEVLKTPLGELDTLKLERHKPNSRRKSTLWCAKELQFLPVKVENVEKDGRITVALIKSLNGIPH